MGPLKGAMSQTHKAQRTCNRQPTRLQRQVRAWCKVCCSMSTPYSSTQQATTFHTISSQRNLGRCQESLAAEKKIECSLRPGRIVSGAASVHALAGNKVARWTQYWASWAFLRALLLFFNGHRICYDDWSTQSNLVAHPSGIITSRTRLTIFQPSRPLPPTSRRRTMVQAQR